MGLFLDMSGIANVKAEEVVRSIKEFTEQYGGRFEPAPADSNIHNTVTIAEAQYDKVTVVHCGDYQQWPELSAYLSRSLNAPVFYFHIHDDSIWIYILYISGEWVDTFNPVPDYWNDDISEEDRRECAGSVAIIRQYWPDVIEAEIQNYLQPWYEDAENDDDDYNGEWAAYEDDDHPIGDAWQLVDFMRKLGLVCPVNEDLQVTAGTIYRFQIPVT